MRFAFILLFGLIVFSCKKDKTPPPPVPPASLTATAISTSQINLGWTDNSTNETGFKVERKTGAGNYAEVASLGQNITSYSDAGLTKNTTYTYRVSAFNTGGSSTTYTNEASATTFDDVPATATNLTATGVSASQINLAWEDKATNETGYKVERKPVNGSYSVVATIGANTASYSDNGLTANTIYTYRVFPYNTFGNGAYSNEASDTTLPDITSGLVAYYPFTGNAGDSSGNGNHGTVNGATLTSDRFGSQNKAYKFDGINDFIVTNNLTYGGQINYTITCWVLLDSAFANGFPQHYIIHNGPTVNGIYLNVDTSEFQFGCNSIYSNISLYKWNHFVGVISNNSYELYINGNLINTQGNCNKSFLNSSPLTIGASSINTEFTIGKIDEIRIYNRVLSKEQIAYLATH